MTSNDNLYLDASDMEPLMPKHGGSELTRLVCDLLRSSGKLSGLLNPITRRSIADLLRSMNSYYSNLIEGHRTSPYDIEKALNHDFSQDQKQKDLQLEGLAHIRVQKELEARLLTEPDIQLFSKEWICWIHEEFYNHLPESFRNLTDEKGRPYEVIPGQLRLDNVTVGHHTPPHYEALPKFMTRFQHFYESQISEQPMQILAIAASHHRLAWIHPFMDGNGRVVRLFSHALFMRHKLDADGLWAISRGLARSIGKYSEWLATADKKRNNDYDGRGRMSDKELFGFSKYFLETAIDQISFMSSLLELETLENRIEKYLLFVAKDIRAESAKHLLWEALRRGEFQRGEAPRITNMQERTARTTLKSLLDAKLLVSETEKGPVRLGLPIDALEFYFPRLYPEGFLRDTTGVI